jgi:ribosomal protein L14E/L6E/L27E
MDKPTAAIGRIAQSKAGRDAGKFFIIYGLQGSEYAMIADGRYHKTGRPKKKKLKHLRLLEDINTVIADKIIAGKKVFDSEINSALKTYNNKTENKSEGDANV